jgi:UrcA family protein
MLSHRSAVVCTLALGTLGMFCAVSRAAYSLPSEHPLTRVVRFGDLDLGSSRGVKALYVRIRGAARTVCGENERPDSLLSSAPFDNCVRAAIESAVAQIKLPALTAYYEQHRPASPRLIIATR